MSMRGAEALTADTQPGGELGAEVEAWLRAELPAAWVQAIDRDDARALAVARESVDVEDWWRRLGKTGYFVPTWPREYGGHEADVSQARSVRAVLARYKVPRPLTNRRMAEIRGRSPEFGSFAAVTKIFRDEHTKRLHDLAITWQDWPGCPQTTGATRHRGRSCAAAPRASAAGRWR